MAPKKVLVLCPSDRMGGAEGVLRLVTLEALRRGHEVDVLCLSAGTGAVFSKLEHPLLSFRVFSRTRELFGVLRCSLHFLTHLGTHYDLAFSSHVHCNAYLGMLRATGLLKTESLVCRESTVIARRFFGLRRLYYRMCYLFYASSVDQVICQTDDMKGALKRFAPWLRTDRLQVRSNPIASEEFVRAVKTKVGESPLVVSVGRLIAEKGYSTLIEAFALLLRHRPGARLDIYGEGPLLGLLGGQIDSLGINGKVRMCGFTPAPLQVMAAADVCVVSSVREGFPNTLLEMMKANSRVVSTLCADGIERIRGLVTCAPENAVVLAQAIERVISGSSEGSADLFDAELARRTPIAFFDSLIEPKGERHHISRYVPVVPEN